MIFRCKYFLLILTAFSLFGLFTTGCVVEGWAVNEVYNLFNPAEEEDKSSAPVLFVSAVGVNNRTYDLNVPVTYAVRDVDSSEVTISVEFSTDNITFSPVSLISSASGAGTISGSSITGIPVTPLDQNYTFTWDASADIPPLASGTANSGIYIRVTPNDGKKNGVPSISQSLTIGNSPPVVTMTDPAAVEEGNVIIRFELLDSTEDPANITVEYSTAGGAAGTWNPALLAAGQTLSLATSSSGTGMLHDVVWNTILDIGALQESTVVFRVIATDNDPSTPGTTSLFEVNNTGKKPAAVIDTVERDKESPIEIFYRLFDVTEDLVNITVEYSLNGGGTWIGATAHFTSEPITNLSSEIQGKQHSFTWDFATDIGSGVNTDVLFKIVPSDLADGTGSEAVSNPFTTGNQAPSVTVTYPAAGDSVTGNVDIVLTLTDTSSDPADILIEYSKDGGGYYEPATIVAGIVSSAAASPAGVEHTLTWSTMNDIGFNNNPNVCLRVTPSDPDDGLEGADFVTPIFTALNEGNIPYTVIEPMNRIQSSPYDVNFSLFDSAGDPVDVEFEYSIDSKTSWNTVTQQAGAEISLTGLTASPEGTSYTLKWDVSSILADPLQPFPQCSLRVRGTDPDGTLGWLFSNTFVTGNNTPTVNLIDFSPDVIFSGSLLVGIFVADTESDLVSVLIECSVDDGVSFTPVPEGDITDGGITGLATVPGDVTAGGGKYHSVIWDSVLTLGPTVQNQCLLRITVSDKDMGQTDTMISAFTIDNTTQRCSARIAALDRVTDTTSALIPYTLFDQTSDTVSIVVEFSTGGAFTPCSPGIGGDGDINLTSSPDGVAHVFDWNWAADLTNTLIYPSVVIRITPSDSITGNMDTSNEFVLGQTPPDITLATPSGIQSGDVVIEFDAVDATADAIDVLITYEQNLAVAGEPRHIGDGATAGFSGTLANVPVSPGSVMLSVDGTGVLFDTGNGQLYDRGYIDRGDIDYSTGDYVITFESAPASGDAVNADYVYNEGTLLPATILSQMTGLPSSPGGIHHALAWDSEADLGSGRYVTKIHVTPTDEFGLGGTEKITTDIFLDNYPLVQFSDAVQSHDEDDGDITVTCRLSEITEDDVTVPVYVSAASTAADTDDYVIAASPLVISAGSLSNDIVITLKEDLLDEPDETLIINMGIPIGGQLGALITHTVTITDNDDEPSVQFTLASSSGAEADSSADLQIELNTPSGQDVSVDYTAADISAAGGGTDYMLQGTGTVTIPAGSSTANISLTLTSDFMDEEPETFQVTLSGPDNAVLVGNTAHTFTINDSDDSPVIGFSTAARTVTEDVGSITATVQLDAESGRDVTIEFGVGAGSTGTSPEDFTISTASPLTIPAGSMSADITINIIEDGVPDSGQTLELELSNPDNASLVGINPHTVTINDPGLFPTVTFSQATQADLEDTPGGIMTVTCTLSELSAVAVSVPFSVDNAVSSAEEGVDFTLSASPLVIPIGSLSADITINLNAEGKDEYNETVILDMGVPTNADQGAIIRHTATIVDNDDPPTVSFSLPGQVSVDETNLSTMTVTAALSALSSKPVTVPFTVDLLSTAESGTDFTLTASPVTISAETPSADITITILGDGSNENDETVTLNIGTPTNATVGATPSHTAVITDDDPLPSVTFNTASSSGLESTDSVDLAVDVISGRDVSVGYEVTSLDALGSGVDYTLLGSGTLVIPAGAGSGNISFTVNNDELDEDDEIIVISLINLVNANPGVNMSHTYTITDNDTEPDVSFTVSNQSAGEESGSVTVTCVLSKISGRPVSVPFALNGGLSTASDPDDYTMGVNPIEIPAGSATGTTIITLAHDDLNEDDETVVLDMLVPVNANKVVPDSHTVTLTDDDQLPVVDFNILTSSGGEGGPAVTLNVDLTPASGRNVTVDYSGVGGTAVSGTDYTFVGPGTLTIAAGNTTGTVSFNVTPDLLNENIETAEIGLTNPDNAILGVDDTHTYTIIDADPLPTIQFNAVSSSGLESVTPVLIQVDLDPVSGRDVTVNYAVKAVGGGTATGGGTDYTLDVGTLTIPEGDVSGTISLDITGDDLAEPDETVVIELSGEVNAVLGVNEHTYTILNDDSLPNVSFATASQASAAENGVMTVTVLLDELSGEDVTVPYVLSGGATESGAGDDYDIAPNPVIIPAGDISADITITILPDGTPEANETIILTMNGVLNATPVAPTVHTATITNDDSGVPEVSFVTTNQSADENAAGVMTVTCLLSVVCAQDVTVPFTTAGGSATEGVGDDFTVTASPVIIPAGDISTVIEVTVNGDTLYESDETVVVDMQPPTNATEGTPSTHTITIVNDDPVPTVEFTAASQSVNEDPGGALTITCLLNDISFENVTVPFLLSGSAAEGEDYTVAANPVTIPAGSMSADITVTVLNDPYMDFTEEIVVTMDTPVGATPTGITQHTITIIPDADSNATGPSVVIDPIADTAAPVVPVIFTLSDPDAGDDSDLTVEYFNAGWSTASSAGGDNGILDLGNGTFLFNWNAESDIGSGPSLSIDFRITATDSVGNTGTDTYTFTYGNPAGFVSVGGTATYGGTPMAGITVYALGRPNVAVSAADGSWFLDLLDFPSGGNLILIARKNGAGIAQKNVAIADQQTKDDVTTDIDVPLADQSFTVNPASFAGVGGFTAWAVGGDSKVLSIQNSANGILNWSISSTVNVAFSKMNGRLFAGQTEKIRVTVRENVTGNESGTITLSAPGAVDAVINTDIILSVTMDLSTYFTASEDFETAAVQLYGAADNECAGSCTGSAGDLDGDGDAELIIGSSGDTGGNGKISIFKGDAVRFTDNNTGGASVAVNGAGTENLGSVYTSGDFNDDGYKDIAVGASGSAGGDGRVYVFYGHGLGDIDPDYCLKIDGEAGWTGFPGSLAAGDFNGDGFDDLAVTVLLPTSRAYVFYGGIPGLSAQSAADADVTIIEEQAGMEICSVADGGDTNFNGFNDLMVGAWQFNNGAGNEGAALIFHGSAVGIQAGSTSDADVRLTGTANRRLGISLAGLGDRNNDGYPDIAVGATEGTWDGGIYVWYGRPGGILSGDSLTTDITADGWEDQAGTPLYSSFGSLVVSAGDLDGDGYIDLLSCSDDGGAFMARGASRLGRNPSAWFQEPGGTAPVSLGLSGGGGDFDGDGFSDLVIGDPDNNGVGTARGRAFLRYGRQFAKGSVMSGAAADGFATVMDNAGDFNSDGFPDIIVGAPLADVGVEGDAGAAYIFYGSAIGPKFTGNPQQTADVILTAAVPLAGEELGTAVSFAGDYDNDGFDDVVVGAPGAYDGRGAAYIFFGASEGFAAVVRTPDIGTNSVASLGYDVAGGGDIDGNGFPDIAAVSNGNNKDAYVFFSIGDRTIALGAGRSESEGVSGKGSSVVIYPDPQGGADYLITGSTTSAHVLLYYYLGAPDYELYDVAEGTFNPVIGAAMGENRNIAVIPRLNNDDYPDLVIGAPGDGISVFYGTPMASSADITEFLAEDARITDAGAIGYSVSNGGDLNNDGYDDILVGTGADSEAYIFYGSASGVGTGVFTLAAAVDAVITNTSDLGTAAAGGFDLNMDGADDLILTGGGNVWFIPGRIGIIPGGND